MLDTFRSFFAPPISAEPEQSTGRLAWIVRLRWVAIAAQLLSVPPALHFHLLEPEMLAYFAGIIALLAALNVITWLGLKRGQPSSQPQILFQLGADIAALSSLLMLTGGAWNPLAPILFVHAVLGSLLLEGRLALGLFAMLIGCLVLIQNFSVIPSGLQGTLVPPEILFPAQLIFAGAFSLLTSWLSRTLGGLQAHFALLRERKTRIDRLRAVGALAAGLSHEFATPLNTAQLKLSRLARTHGLEDEEDVRVARDALERCGEVLKHMAGSQLRPEGLTLEVIEVDQLVERVCTSISRANESATIHFVSSGRPPRGVLLPSVAFSQAVLNLIDNALKAAPGRPVEVVVDSGGGRVQVSVLDRGEGWPEVVRKHLGEPFVTTRAEGVGLGLYYVHTLAEALGAQLELDDRPSGGAVARLVLTAVPLPSTTPATNPSPAPAEAPA